MFGHRRLVAFGPGIRHSPQFYVQAKGKRVGAADARLFDLIVWCGSHILIAFGLVNKPGSVEGNVILWIGHVKHKNDKDCIIITEIIVRIEQFRESLRLSREDFCAGMDFPYGTYASYIGKRASAPNLKLIVGIATTYDANIEWLLTGQSNMLSDPSEAAKMAGATIHPDDVLDALAAHITAKNEKIRFLENRTGPIAWDQELADAWAALLPEERERIRQTILGAPKQEPERVSEASSAGE